MAKCKRKRGRRDSELAERGGAGNQGMCECRVRLKTKELQSNSLRADALRAKISGKEICFPLTRIKNNWVAEFVDSEGNHIEVTAPVKE